MKRIFSSEAAAHAFARKVDGKVRCQTLPGYMSTEIIWVVEW